LIMRWRVTEYSPTASWLMSLPKPKLLTPPVRGRAGPPTTARPAIGRMWTSTGVVRYRHDGDGDVRLFTETLVAELVAAGWWMSPI
jgi:hypothetical protein